MTYLIQFDSFEPYCAERSAGRRRREPDAISVIELPAIALPVIARTRSIDILREGILVSRKLRNQRVQDQPSGGRGAKS